MLKVGLLGLPNAGKSTLFNALSEAEALAAPYPFSTVETNKAVMDIPDQDFEALGAAIDAPDLKYSQLQLWDIAGLVEGANEGEGLGNEFLGQIKNCDLLLHVVRIGKESAADDVARDVEVIKNEIALFDHRLLLRPFEKARRLTKLYPRDVDYKRQDAVFTQAYYGTKDGKTVEELFESDDREELFRDIGLVSLKPQILVANTDGSAQAAQIAEAVGAKIALNAEELHQLQSLTPEERVELGYEPGDTQAPVYALARELLRAAAMKRVYTVGHLGVGQWIIGTNATAKECAALVHGEMGDETKNVRVALMDDFKHLKDWNQLAKQGKIKTYNAAKYVPGDTEVLQFD